VTTAAAPTVGTGITVKTSHVFFILYWYLMKPHLQIDGQPISTKGWGETFAPLQPGQHTVYCYAQSVLGFGFKAAKSTMTVDVAPGQVVHLQWKAPIVWLPFIKGKWTVLASPPAPVAV
jgi:hypothetical protein